MANTKEFIRAVVHYEGEVQGVGFRMAAVSQVRGAPIYGWVKNEPDGGVRLEAEGLQIDIEQFLDRVRYAMESRIESERIEWIGAKRTESGFVVRY